MTLLKKFNLYWCGLVVSAALIVAGFAPWPDGLGKQRRVADAHAVSLNVSSSSNATGESTATSTGNSSTTAAHRAIETLKVGERVVTGLPSDAAGETRVDTATWKKVSIRAPWRWGDGTEDCFEIETLQPPECLRRITLLSAPANRFPRSGARGAGNWRLAQSNDHLDRLLQLTVRWIPSP